MQAVIRTGWVWLLAVIFSMAVTAPAWAKSETVALIEQASQQVFQTLREDPERTRNDPDFLYEVVEEIILPIIDFEGVSRLILARHWRTATPEQRERFVNAFRGMLVRTYALQMADHLDKDIRVLPNRSNQDERMAQVATEIVMGQGQSNLSVIYSLRPVDGEWKVFDLTVEGLSLVGNFRTNFGAEVERQGLDRVIARLEQGDESLIEDATEAARQ